MESNLPVISKRVWRMVRVAFFIMRKKLSKGKVMKDLNMMLKRRGKVAGKVIANIMFHRHHKGSTRSHHSHNSFTSSQAPPTPLDEAMTMSAMKTILNTLNNDQEIVEASPALSIFERSSRVRQLRVTDSPFPLRDDDDGKDNQIDKAAEDFIKRFYRQLRKQDGVIN
ncbi:uncharacterized protein LOC131648427 [Vicia villosa]|uniref:uncharacterized protein LOC131648427 n=1 Tax=Vicia villosa TaxID=3911 RepID=UPI00273CBAC6|nr:uncharacterized protein LOC131648427 [Vicia villosa]